MPERFVLSEADLAILGGSRARLLDGRQRVDAVLPRLMSGRSRATVQRWIAEGRVLVDGVTCRRGQRVGAGAVLEVEAGPDPISRATADASVPFDVLYEDDDLLVVCKPAGVTVHPARGHRTGTLVNGLLARAQSALAPADEKSFEGHLRPGIVHRIDKDTSGLLVVAKNAHAREGLKAQLAEHTMQRLYQALTWGVPVEGTIETWHGRDPRSRLRFTSRLTSGKRARTQLRVLERLADGAAALVECRLQTGRTHQIRVHLAERVKTPLLADALYGGVHPPGPIGEIAQRLGRQALHARTLGFVHPASGTPMHFEAPLPEDLRLALAALRSAGARDALES